MNSSVQDMLFAASITLPRSDGLFEGALKDFVEDISRRKPTILCVFPPKCGGTFLRAAACYAVGGKLIRSVHAQGGREAQLYLPVFLQYYCDGFGEAPMITHVHMQARPGNCHFIEAFHLKPVIMVRSIPDMLVSLMDMFAGSEGAGENICCEVPDDFDGFSDAKKGDFLIDMFAPWYVGFFASWFGYAVRNPGVVLILHFADLAADPAPMLGRLLAHSGLPQTPEVCQNAVKIAWQKRNDYRFNKGVGGRGRAFFSPQQLS
jgi:hypothetical protein